MRSPVFHTGQPIGTLLPVTAASSGPQAGYQLTSTAASVGPYRLCSGAPVKRSHSRHSSVGSASPLQNTRRSVRQQSTLSGIQRGDKRRQHRRHEVGGGHAVVGEELLHRLRIAVRSGSAITSCAPAINGHQNSHTDTSKLHGVFCATTSSADNG